MTMGSVGSITVKDVKLPYVLKDKIIFSPGVHNGFKYSELSIRRGYENTQWNARTESLYHAHKDEFVVNPETGERDLHVGAEIDDYAGSIKNIIYKGQGVIKGDIYIWDLNTALKMMGGAKVGISPAGKIKPNGAGEVEDMVIHNWAVTVNPAIKTTFVNSEEDHWVGSFAMSEDKSIVNKMGEEEEDKDKSTAEETLKELVASVSALTTEVAEMKKKEGEDKDKDEEYAKPEDAVNDEDEDTEDKEKDKKEKYPEDEALDEDKEDAVNAEDITKIATELNKLSEDDVKMWTKFVKDEGLEKGRAKFGSYARDSRVSAQESDLTLLKEEVTALKEDLKDAVAKPESVLTLTGKVDEKGEFDLVEIENSMKDYLVKVTGSI